MSSHDVAHPEGGDLDRGSNAPLIVLLSFLLTADSTPLDQRPRRQGYTLGADGQPLADPAADPRANAFDGDPNINFEKWDDYWRKVNGVRFLHVEDSNDRHFGELRRYDQIHRVSCGPTSSTPLPYRAPVDSNGMLYGDVVGRVPAYARPRWDGAAYLNFDTESDFRFFFSSDRIANKIWLEDRLIFRDMASMLSRQFIILPSRTCNEAVVMVRIHIRTADIDRAVFQHRWLNEHAALVTEQMDTQRLVKRYVQLHNIGDFEAGDRLFHSATQRIDGVSLMGFSSMNDIEEFVASDGYRAIEAHEKTLCTEREYWSAVNFVMLNRMRKESVSIKKRD
jgi:hypothetical protein